MNDFLHDLWHDLRARRLWPVAVALVVALVAVPLLLIKPADTPPPAAQSATAAPPDRGIPGVDVTTAADAASSDLDVFVGKDPFKSPASVRKAAKAVVTAAPSLPTSDLKAPSSSGGGGGASTPSKGGSGGGGSAPSTPKASPPRVIVPKRKAYTYVLDVTFGSGGETRRIRTMRRFRMLPSSRSPFLVFLGVDSSGERAVFLVDSRLKQTGEGVCRPSADGCAFLYLKTSEDRNEHYFTTEDGTEYSLKLNDIRRAAVRKSSASSSRTKKPARSSSTPAGAGGKQKQPFVPPVLIDLGIGG